jgi:hypothetical protein
MPPPTALPESLIAPPVRARALAVLLATMKLDHPNGTVDWQADTPAADPEKARQAVTELLLDALPEPDSHTHRLRVIRDFLGQAPISRRGLLRQHVIPLVWFDHLTPTYWLDDADSWRAFCQFGDEELYVAAAVAAMLSGPGLNGREQVDLLNRVLMGWPMFLQPADQDFRQVLTRGLHDAHVHLGELTPAPVLWRLIMTEKYVVTSGEPAWLREAARTEVFDLRHRLRRKLLLDDRLVHLVERDERLLEPFPQMPDSTPPDASALLRQHIRHYLMAERVLLVRGFRGPHSPDVEAEFWTYVAARMRFMRAIVHPGRGFEAFARNRGLVYAKGRHSDERERVLQATVRPSLSHLLDSGVRRIDVRFALRDTFDEVNVQMKRIAKEIPPNDGTKWYFVCAFSRAKAYLANRDFGRRPEGWRRYRGDVTKVVKLMLNKLAEDPDWPFAPFAALGIDMISSEYGFDAGIVAPAYHLTRPAQSVDPDRLLWARSADRPDRPRLIRCYHTGEDREHPVSAARTTWEAVQWLGLGARDRLAHLVYLADAPRAYTVGETLGERLDNLTWLYALQRAAGPGRWTGPVTHWLSDELARVSSQVHQACQVRPTPDDLIEAWRLRPREEIEQGGKYFPNVSHAIRKALLGYSGIDGLRDFALEARKVDRADAQQVYEVRARMATGEYPAEVTAIALTTVRDLVLVRGIDLETCPSSNRLIGSELTDPAPGGVFLDTALSPHLLVGTDDPSMFKTDLTVELAILVRTVLDGGMPRVEALRRVSQVAWRTEGGAG